MDEPRIIAFLRDHWKSDHIFVTNPELLRWQHQSLSSVEDDLNFVLAEEEPGHAGADVIALLGYIPIRRFASESDGTQLALAIWKIRDDSGVPGLGLQLLRFLERELTPSLVFAIGISDIVKPLYQALGYELGIMQHSALFRPEPSISERIATGVPEDARADWPIRTDVKLSVLEGSRKPSEIDIEGINIIGRLGLPHKSWSYLVNRYIEHPWYRYQLRSVAVDGELKAIIVWREVSARDAKILRIVDIVGDCNVLALCGGALRSELFAAGAEYIDLVSAGVSEDVLRKAGFASTADHPSLVLPNYFAPFEQKNVSIAYAFRRHPLSANSAVRLFRADSDQDRPNTPSELGIEK